VAKIFCAKNALVLSRAEEEVEELEKSPIA
jgi:hypothetical protein